MALRTSQCGCLPQEIPFPFLRVTGGRLCRGHSPDIQNICKDIQSITFVSWTLSSFLALKDSWTRRLCLKSSAETRTQLHNQADARQIRMITKFMLNLRRENMFRYLKGQQRKRVNTICSRRLEGDVCTPSNHKFVIAISFHRAIAERSSQCTTFFQPWHLPSQLFFAMTDHYPQITSKEHVTDMQSPQLRVSCVHLKAED